MDIETLVIERAGKIKAIETMKREVNQLEVQACKWAIDCGNLELISFKWNRIMPAREVKRRLAEATKKK